ncbi:phosphatidylinositol-binding protein scs2 [Saitoella coloradoensis]
MSVELEPSNGILAFRRPFTQMVKEALVVRNPNNQPVAFKVKTTAPKQYCVRPNSGRIEAGGVVEVQVLLQAMKEDPPLDHKSKDKFLIQSTPITADLETTSLADLWAHIESHARTSIQEKKIRVQYLPAGGVDGGHHVEPSESATVAHDRFASSVSQPESPISPIGDLNKYANASNASPAPRSIPGTAAPASYNLGEPITVGATNATTTSTGFSASARSGNSELEEARDKISRLEKELQEQQTLRQRNVSGSEKSSTAAGAVQSAVVQGAQGAQGAQGVPVQYVVALCLAAFFLAYFAF